MKIRLLSILNNTILLIHGEGHLTRHEHRKRKRRAWRKLLIGVSNRFIVVHYLSGGRKADGEIELNLIHHLGQINSIARFPWVNKLSRLMHKAVRLWTHNSLPIMIRHRIREGTAGFAVASACLFLQLLTPFLFLASLSTFFHAASLTHCWALSPTFN